MIPLEEAKDLVRAYSPMMDAGNIPGGADYIAAKVHGPNEAHLLVSIFKTEGHLACMFGSLSGDWSVFISWGAPE